MNPTRVPDAMDTTPQSKTIRQSAHSESTEPDNFQIAGQDANAAGLYLDASVDRVRIFCSRSVVIASGIFILGDVMRRPIRIFRAARGSAKCATSALNKRSRTLA